MKWNELKEIIEKHLAENKMDETEIKYISITAEPGAEGPLRICICEKGSEKEDYIKIVDGIIQD